jgi:hypothetical protein
MDGSRKISHREVARAILPQVMRITEGNILPRVISVLLTVILLTVVLLTVILLTVILLTVILLTVILLINPPNRNSGDFSTTLNRPNHISGLFIKTLEGVVGALEGCTAIALRRRGHCRGIASPRRLWATDHLFGGVLLLFTYPLKSLQLRVRQ